MRTGSWTRLRAATAGLSRAASALALFAAAAAAGAAPSAAWAEDCAKAQTQADINECAARNGAAADEALNAAYAAATKEPGMAARLDRLRAAERAWIGYRDAQCAFEGSAYEGGSLQPFTASTCAEALTKRRTAELKKALACAKDQAQC